MTGWPVEVEAGDGVVLRAPDPIDATGITDAVNSSLPHLSRFLDWAREPATVDAQAVRQAIAREAFDAGGDAMYTIFVGDEVVGAVGLHRRLGPDALEIGYWLRADQEGRGIMTAAVIASASIGSGDRSTSPSAASTTTSSGHAGVAVTPNRAR